MLTRIRIQNFRLCKDVIIENAGETVALVGPNGAGKSNILQAIAKTARSAVSTEATDFSDAFVIGDDLSVELEFKAQSHSYRYLRKFATFSPVSRMRMLFEDLDRIEAGTYVPILQRRHPGVVVSNDRRMFQIGETASCIPAISTLLPAEDPLVTAIAPARTFLSAVRYYPLDEPVAMGDEERLISSNEYSAWLAKFRSTGNIGDSVLMRIIHMFIEKPEHIEVLKHFLGQNGLGLVDDIQNGKILAGSTSTQGAREEFYEVVFVPSTGSTSTPLQQLHYNALSLGTRRIIRIFTSMLFDDSSVMLLEQPEDGLHQGLIRKVIGLLRQNALDTQLIMSSHSSSLLNTLKAEEVRLVLLRDGLTTARQFNSKELQLAARFMNEEGTLYEFVESAEED